MVALRRSVGRGKRRGQRRAGCRGVCKGQCHEETSEARSRSKSNNDRSSTTVYFSRTIRPQKIDFDRPDVQQKRSQQNKAYMAQPGKRKRKTELQRAARKRQKK